VRSSEHIQQEIAAVEQAVQAIAQEFRSAYAEYLAALGQVVYQQLILASYRLCTQGYPERFVRLSLKQRQQLQQSIRQLGQQAQAQLIAALQQPSNRKSNLDRQWSILHPKHDASESEASDPSEFESLTFESLTLDEYQLELIEASKEQEQPEPEPEPEPPLCFDQPMSPNQLRRWQASLEQNISEIMRSTSYEVNRVLQKVNILPSKLPEPVLAAASKSGIVAEAMGSAPNLLNLLIETEEQEESKVTQIIAIRLLLAEIEFGDATLAGWRSNIRSLLARLNQMEREYQKKQRERVIAEAETAWRSSWYED
jgi:hypothetical protein